MLKPVNNIYKQKSHEYFRARFAITKAQKELLPKRTVGSEPWFDLYEAQFRFMMNKTHRAFELYKKKRTPHFRLKLKQARKAERAGSDDRSQAHLGLIKVQGDR